MTGECSSTQSASWTSIVPSSSSDPSSPPTTPVATRRQATVEHVRCELRHSEWSGRARRRQSLSRREVMCLVWYVCGLEDACDREMAMSRWTEDRRR